MNFSDDHTSPAAPFSKNDIFDDDVISGSPITSERMVETLSGYLVVVKKVDGSRVGLSVKRRIGTPPSTSILLTPDEQVKLAKILADAKSLTASKQHHRVSPRVERWTSGLSRKTRSGEEPESAESESPEQEFARVAQEREEEMPRRRRRRGTGWQPNRAQIASVALGVLAGPIIGIMLVSSFTHKKSDAAKVTAAAATMEEARIDRFVRTFVGDMLDFNPATYKTSQVHAMSVMTPELLEKYWKETNFPLSNEQLSGTPKGQTLIITKVNQAAGAGQITNVDLFAELVSADSKVSTPVHLQIKVDEGIDNQLRVLDQKDLSSAK